MSQNVLESLQELSSEESVAALQKARALQSVLIFKAEPYNTIMQSYIESVADKKAYLNKEISKLDFQLESDISIKFNLGTEVFFVKTQFKRHLNQLYFEMSSKVFQLRRRKEMRYLVPKRWNQSAAILKSLKTSNLINCYVQDISLTGIRFEFFDKFVKFERGDLLKIQFQVYKRAEVVTDASVRFFLPRPSQTTLLGMELNQLSAVQKERVASIIEDIIQYESNHSS